MNIPANRSLLAVLLIIAPLQAPVASADPVGNPGDAATRGEVRDEARFQQPENYCLGGIEDRKIIVDESQITNPFRETSRLGCEVDGGDPHTMPDLPSPTPELRRLV